MLQRNSISTADMPPPDSSAAESVGEDKKSRRKISRNGSQLKIRKPWSVPAAKQPWSWLKERCRRFGCGDGGESGGEVNGFWRFGFWVGLGLGLGS